MDEEKGIPQNNPVSELLTHFKEFLATHEIDPKLEEREIFWTEQMKSIRQAEEKKEMTTEEGDRLRGSIVAAQEYLASHDGLTGLYNQREFKDRFSEAWAHTKRHNEDLTILILDMDNLKYINEGPGGHPAGSRAIQDVAVSINQSIRMGDDVAARWGGDEFGIILPNIDGEQGKIVANRILEHLRKTTREAGRPVTASIGIGQMRLNQSTNLDEYFKNVDDALKEAKKEGKDRVVEIND